MSKILLATGNQAKVERYSPFLIEKGFSVLTPKDFPNLNVEALENSPSLEENAKEKALAWSIATQLPAVAEDSGFWSDDIETLGAKTRRLGEEKEKTDEEMRDWIRQQIQSYQGKATGEFRRGIAVAFPNEHTITEEKRFPRILMIPPQESIRKGYPFETFFLYPNQKFGAEMPSEELETVARGNETQAILKFWVQHLRQS
ncbi:MAG: XTP/dITP diphosphohydrolase [bacterium]|jgi:XTP/dITP diphosphohydrolase